jgi:UDP-3-O-[3-hydroxymyristoyl] glucosamine N-acyltransferase
MNLYKAWSRLNFFHFCSPHPRPERGVRVSVQIREIVDAFPDLLSLVRGSGDAAIGDLQTGVTASDTSLVFASTADHLREAAASPARAIVVGPKLVEHVPNTVPTVIVAKSATLAMAVIAAKFFADRIGHRVIEGPDVHPAAHVAKSARVGSGSIVGPGAVIGENCVIGERCVIGANAVLEPGVTIGDDTRLYPLVYVGHSCSIGRRCVIKSHASIGTPGFGYAQDDKFNHHHLTHYGRVVIDDDVHVGASVQIDRGTFEDSRVGRGTKIDNHCHFGHNIQIGERNLITAGMLTAGSTTIGNRNVFGGRATVKGHLRIGDGVHVGGISSIGKDLLEPGEYGGHPLQPMADELRTRAAIKKLPDLVKQVRAILKHLGLEGGTK